jgi:glycosyltransferase involved in cell wall biosynthesis
MNQADVRVLYVMPVFNAEAWLRDSLGSIMSQDYEAIDILCIDDGSTDRSLAYLNEMAAIHDSITVQSQPNRGPGAAFNEGIRYALERGYSYVARMDADDIAHPAKTRCQVDVLEANPALAACGCNATYFFRQGETCGHSLVPSDPQQIRREVWAGGRGLIQGATMFRTWALHEVGGYRPQKTPAEDTDMFLRLTSRFPVVNLKEVLYRIRIQPNSHSLANVHRTRLYHHYYLHLARLRVEDLDEIEFDEFVQSLSKLARAQVYREATSITAYFKWMTTRSMPALVAAAVLDPARTFRRIFKNACARNKSASGAPGAW